MFNVQTINYSNKINFSMILTTTYFLIIIYLHYNLFKKYNSLKSQPRYVFTILSKNKVEQKKTLLPSGRYGLRLFFESGG